MSRKIMINELDLVALSIDRPALGLHRGDVGTVVHIYGSGTRYEVEFINAKGDTMGVETLTDDEVRPVDLGRVILHYNQQTGSQKDDDLPGEYNFVMSA